MYIYFFFQLTPSSSSESRQSAMEILGFPKPTALVCVVSPDQSLDIGIPDSIKGKTQAKQIKLNHWHTKGKTPGQAKLSHCKQN